MKPSEVNEEIAALKKQIENLRAQLMHLRVHQQNPTGVRGRTGWMVSAFIPDSVLSALRRRPEGLQDFITLVAHALVSNAINRILFVSNKGEVSALIFTPADESGTNFNLAGTLFHASPGSADSFRLHDKRDDETDAAYEKRKADIDRRMLEIAEAEQGKNSAAKMLGYDEQK